MRKTIIGCWLSTIGKLGDKVIWRGYFEEKIDNNSNYNFVTSVSNNKGYFR